MPNLSTISYYLKLGFYNNLLSWNQTVSFKVWVERVIYKKQKQVSFEKFFKPKNRFQQFTEIKREPNIKYNWVLPKKEKVPNFRAPERPTAH
jgi:dsRNA-specific ribonuclease